MSRLSEWNGMEIPVNSLRSRSPASRYIDLFKGLSALYLMMYYLQTQLFVKYDEIDKVHIGIKFLYQLTSFGSPLVTVFFVINGYIISANQLRAIQMRRWSWPAYLSNGLIGRWKILLPALVLTGLWGVLTIHSFGVEEGQFNLSGRTLLGNLFFLQGIQADNFGANLPLWILSYEFWFNILFACLIQAFFGATIWKKTIYLVIALSIGFFVGLSVLAYFTFWLLGSLLAIVPMIRVRSKIVQSIAIAGSILLLWLALLGNRFMNSGSDPNLLVFPLHFGVGIASTILLYFIICFHNRTKRVTPFRDDQGFSKWLSRLSYPLIFTHLPVIMFFTSWLGRQSWQPTPLRLAYSGVIGIGIVLYAWLISSVTEAGAQRIKALLRSPSLLIYVSSQKPKNYERQSHSTKLPKQ